MSKQRTWRQIIATARRRKGGFTGLECEKAADWVTCACGRQDPRIPRGGMGVPMDDELTRLGIVFSRAVAVQNFDLAEETLRRIDDRAAIVLRQEATKL